MKAKKDEIIHIALSDLKSVLAQERQVGMLKVAEWVNNNIAVGNMPPSHFEWKDYLKEMFKDTPVILREVGDKVEIKTRSGCVSCIANCRTCGWTYENKSNGVAIAFQHASKFGHEVSIQVVRDVTYFPVRDVTYFPAGGQKVGEL